MYNITKETESKSKYKEFNAGITPDVALSKVSFASPRTDGNSPAQLLFEFVGSKGEKHRHVEFEVKEDDPKADDKRGYLASRVKHILCRFMPEDQVILTGSNWSEFANGVITLLGNNHIGKKVAIKLVYDKKGNLGLPYFPDFIATSPSDLKILNKDVMVKPTIVPSTIVDLELSEPIDSNPFGGGPGQAPEIDNLPFN